MTTAQFGNGISRKICVDLASRDDKPRIGPGRSGCLVIPGGNFFGSLGKQCPHRAPNDARYAAAP
jgi:hypothetical protein